MVVMCMYNVHVLNATELYLEKMVKMLTFVISSLPRSLKIAVPAISCGIMSLCSLRTEALPQNS